MKNIILALVLFAIVLSGCPSGGQSGTMLLEMDRTFDFDLMEYWSYEDICADKTGAKGGIENVPDVRASKDLIDEKGCVTIDGFYCEKVSFGTFAKFNKNVVDLGEMSLGEAVVPSSPEFERFHCAEIGHTYYVKTWLEKDVLLEITDITDEGVEVNYIVR